MLKEMTNKFVKSSAEFKLQMQLFVNLIFSQFYSG